ncbi:MAG: SulP family inorganic anion transporter [Candidatus Magasanikbacteria bacterium]|nr:SulP family inorganic anion transporter [Candidatus Magasanikbacteria bacterium]
MILQNIKNNFKSGLTVALISIPLSISLAVASSASPRIGIITAIWAGLIAAVFGGSNFNIVGPTGALSGIVATYVILHGIIGLPMLTIMAGLIILAAYFLKLERYLVLIPSSVIHGFTLGVAFIIGLNQFNFALGLQGLPQHEIFFSNLIESIQHISNISWSTFVVFSLFFIGLIIFKKIAPKIPGAIILTPIGIMLGYLSKTEVVSLGVQTLGDKFGNIPFRIFEMHQWVPSIFMVQTAMVVALIAILETMLSAKIADGMTHTKHNERKEMLGLGLANIASGFMGGMPATAALARTSLNIKTGATHRTSGVVSVLGVALISAFFLGYFKYIPMAVIAAILVFVAVQMVEAEHFAKFWRYERSGFFVALLVAVATIIEDPIFGILLGVALSLLIFVNHLSRGQFDLRVNKFEDGIVDAAAGEEKKEIVENVDVLLYSVRGKLCYINSRAHVARFESSLIKYKYIILRLREVYFIDMDGVEALDEVINITEARGQQVLITSIDPAIVGLLEQMSSGYLALKKKGLIFQKTEYALKFLGIPTRPE